MRLAHDVASQLLDALARQFPLLTVDRNAALFGAATHDLGKILHPDELSQPGNQHEQAGEELLLGRGIEPERARFARTHGAWDRADVGLEDLLVALADSAWKGNRISELETRLVKIIAERTGTAPWRVWAWLDELLEKIASGAEERLAWQQCG